MLTASSASPAQSRRRYRTREIHHCRGAVNHTQQGREYRRFVAQNRRLDRQSVTQYEQAGSPAVCRGIKPYFIRISSRTIEIEAAKLKTVLITMSKHIFICFASCWGLFYVVSASADITASQPDSFDRPDHFHDDVFMSPFIALTTNSEHDVSYDANNTGYTVIGSRMSNSSTTWRKGKHSSLYSTGVLRYFPLYLTPVVILLGAIGNIVSFIVLQKFTRVQQFSSDFHLCTLAVFDTGGLFFSTFPFWANTFLRTELSAQGLHNPLRGMFSYGPCIAWMFASFEFRYLSHWTIVIFSLERYFIISQPFESVTRFTIKRSAIITTCLVLITCLFNIHMFWMFDRGVTPGGGTYCRWRQDFYIATSVHMFLMGLIPSILIVVFNCLMIRNLVKHRKEEPRVVGNSGKEREMQVTRRLIAVSVTFVALTFPFMALATYRNVQALRKQTNFSVAAAELYSFFCFFYMTNYACNFILYCLTGTRFRKAVIRLFRCEPIDADLTTSSTSQRRTSSASCTPNISRHSSTLDLRKDVIETVPLNVVLTRIKMKNPDRELYG